MTKKCKTLLQTEANKIHMLNHSGFCDTYHLSIYREAFTIAGKIETGRVDWHGYPIEGAERVSGVLSCP